MRGDLKTVVVASIVTAIVLGAGLAGAASSAPGASPNVGAPQAAVNANAVISQPPGIPGITFPTPQSGAAPLLSTGAAYTAAEVQESMSSHPIFQLAQPLQPGAGDVESVQFMTAQQASTLLHGEWIGRPDQAIVCYVVVKGPIVIDMSPPDGALSGPIGPANEGIAVLDGQTGNLLLTSYR